MISFPLSSLVNLKARHSQHYHSYTLFILTEESSSVELMKALAKGFLHIQFSPKKQQYCMTSQRKALPSFLFLTKTKFVLAPSLPASLVLSMPDLFWV